MGKTTIAWTDFSFNGWIGCSHKPKHPGCAHCYAEAEQADRRGRVVWGPKGTRSMTSPAYWKNPLRWNALAKSTGRRKRVFAFSLADVFEDWKGHVTQEWTENRHGISQKHQRMITMDQAREEFFHLVDATQYLDWLLLTKRPENVMEMWPYVHRDGVLQMSPYRKNVRLGTSISDQATADQYIPELTKLGGLAKHLFVSAEPLLGPVDLQLQGRNFGIESEHEYVDWVICGGESGPEARPFNLQWARDLIRQCKVAGVPPFMKQVGAKPYDQRKDGPRLSYVTKDKKGGNPDEWPEDLRVREFPR